MRTVTRTAIVTALAVVVLVWSVSAAVGYAEATGLAADGDNPSPSITAISPSDSVVGAPAFTLTVEGEGFVPGSEVRWNDEPRGTVYVSPTRITAEITAGDVAAAQTALVTVFNPEPGGGESASVTFLVAEANPVPTVTGVSPGQTVAGGGGIVISVVGSGFVPGSSVLWNGSQRSTIYVNDSLLRATVRTGDVLTAGIGFVQVTSPPPGGGPSSTSVVFTVENPPPEIETLTPCFVWAMGPGFVLTVDGGGFTADSVVQWAGAGRPTRFVSSRRLEADITAMDVAHAEAITVRVYTPSPGGGLSSPLLAEVRGDDIPPVTVISGLTGLWHRTPTTFTLVATDIGLGVELTFYRIGRSGQSKIGTSVTVRAPKDHGNDGIHVVEYYSVDKAFNWEHPNHEVSVGIDTRPPTTAVRSATVKRGGKLSPRYLVSDVSSPRVQDATLVISKASGTVLQQRDLGRPLTGKWHTGDAFRVALPQGAYRMKVVAHDLAGNPQSVTKAGTLKVL